MTGDEQTPEEYQADQERRQNLDAQQYEDDFTWFMGDPRGRRLMYEWLSYAGVFRTSMTGDNFTFYNEGRREFGLRLLAETHEHCPEQYFKMIQEQQEESHD